jgi:hypothetical protein
MQLNPIYLANNTTHTPQGKGLVYFSRPRIHKILVSNVWNVRTFQKNLLSLVLINKVAIKSSWKTDSSKSTNKTKLQRSDEWL